MYIDYNTMPMTARSYVSSRYTTNRNARFNEPNVAFNVSGAITV